MVDKEDPLLFSIHTVYYDEKGTPLGYSKSPASPVQPTLKMLKGDMDMFKKAFDLPIIWRGEKFPEEFKEEKEG